MLPTCLLLAVVATLAPTSLAARRGSFSSSAEHVDVIIFAQTWPTTNCIEWKEKKETNTCNLPADNQWTVHGIWPSRNGEMGPNYCNRSAPFDPDRIAPLLPDLQAHWTNVHNNTGEFSFWKHEWEKHGTCVPGNIQEIDNEFKFFRKGIDWNKIYSLYSYLSSAGIVPGKKYTFPELYSAVEAQLGGKHPAVQCEYDKELKTKTLAQISICFDMDLKVTNCDHIFGGLNQGCPRSAREILYPDHPFAKHKYDVDSHKTSNAPAFVLSKWNAFVSLITTAAGGYFYRASL